MVKRKGRFYNARLERDVLAAMAQRGMRIIDVCTIRIQEGIWISPGTFHRILSGRVNPRRASQMTKLVFRALGIDLDSYDIATYDGR